MMKILSVFYAVMFLTFSISRAESPDGNTSPQNLVVVELFTSQGCSSCPPADDVLAGFSRQADILALSYSVVGSSRVDLQACKLEYSIVSPK